MSAWKFGFESPSVSTLPRTNKWARWCKGCNLILKPSKPTDLCQHAGLGLMSFSASKRNSRNQSAVSRNDEWCCVYRNDPLHLLYYGNTWRRKVNVHLLVLNTQWPLIVLGLSRVFFLFLLKTRALVWAACWTTDISSFCLWPNSHIQPAVHMQVHVKARVIYNHWRSRWFNVGFFFCQFQSRLLVMLFVVSDLINRYSHRLTDKQFAVIFWEKLTFAFLTWVRWDAWHHSIVCRVNSSWLPYLTTGGNRLAKHGSFWR